MKDWNDVYYRGGDARAAADKAWAEEPKRNGAAAPAVKLADWLERDIAEADYLLGEWLSTTSRVLLVGTTGIGKTMFAIAVAFAIAGNKNFLHWTRPGRPCRVLYIDGEMPRRLMKQRLQDAMRHAGVTPEGLIILSKEDFEDMPPLNTFQGQTWVDERIEEFGPFDLIIFDNIQALLVGDMRDEEQWAGLLPWVRALTRQTIAQIWLHHTGHDESRSYGSKAREWQMDTVGIMERVKDADVDLTFSLRFSKARERTPDNRDDFEPVTMSLRDDKWVQGEAITTKRIGGATKTALDLLRRTVIDAGEKPPASNHIPPDICAVRADLWRQYCYKGTISEADTPESQQKAFRRAQQKLQELGKIGVWDEWVWLA